MPLSNKPSTGDGVPALGANTPFTYCHRLHQGHEFDALFRHKEFQVQHAFASILAKKNALETNRLGMICSKKIAAKAVTRNRIKRHIREVFRQQVTRQRLPNQCLDILVLCKPNIAQADRQTLRNTLLASFDRLITKAQQKT